MAANEIGSVSVALRADTSRLKSDLDAGVGQAGAAATRAGHEMAQGLQPGIAAAEKTSLSLKNLAVGTGAAALALGALGLSGGAVVTVLTGVAGVIGAGVAAAGAARVAYRELRIGMDEVAAAAHRATEINVGKFYRTQADDLAAWGRAAKLVRVDQDDLTAGVKTLQGKLLEARDDESKIREVLNAAGVDIEQGVGPAFKQLATVFEALHRAGQPLLEDQLATKLGISALVPLLEQGAAGVTKFQDASGKTADSLQHVAANTEDARKVLQTTQGQLETLRQAGAAPLSEALSKLGVDWERFKSRFTQLSPEGFDKATQKATGLGNVVAILPNLLDKAVNLADTLATKLGAATSAVVNAVGKALLIAQVGLIETVPAPSTPEGFTATGRPITQAGPGSTVAQLSDLGLGRTDPRVAAIKNALAAGDGGAGRQSTAAQIAVAQGEAELRALDAQRTALAEIAALRSQNLSIAQAQAASETTLATIEATIVAAKRAGIDKEQEGLLAQKKALEPIAAAENKLEATAVEQIRAKGEIRAIDIQLAGLATKRAAIEKDDILFQLAQEANLRAAQLARAQTEVTAATDLLALDDERFAIAQQQGATRAELVTLAKDEDAAERAVNITKIAALQRDLDQLDAKRAQLAVGQQLDALDESHAHDLRVQIDDLGRFNSLLEASPRHVRALHQEFLNVGDTLDGIVANVGAGFATGTLKAGDFAKAGEQAGSAFITELIRSTLKEKGVFDFKIKANLLELAGFSGTAGDKAGGNFVSGLIDQVKSLTTDQHIAQSTQSGGTGAGGAGVLVGTGGDAVRISRSQAASGVTVVGPSTPLTSQERAVLFPRGENVATGGVGFNNQTDTTNASGGNAVAAAVTFGVIAVLAGSEGAVAALRQLKDRPGITTSQLNRESSNAAFKAAGLPASLSYIAGADNPIVGELLKKTGLVQAPTGEAQINRILVHLFEALGLPKIGEGQRGITERPFGFPGGPSTPVSANIAKLGPQAEEIGRLIGQSQPLLPEQGLIPDRVKNALLNEFTALRLGSEDAQKQLLAIATATGKTFDEVIFRLAGLRAQGKVTDTELLTGTAALLKAFGQLPEAVDAGVVALAALDDQGNVTLEHLKRVAADATTAITSGYGAALDALLGGGSTQDAFAALGTESGKVFIDRVKQQLLTQKIAGPFLTKGEAELEQSAEQYAAGHIAKARQLAAQGEADIKIGGQKFVDFLATIAPDLRNISADLGQTSSAGIGSTGIIAPPNFATRIPSWDVGGVVPGERGRAMLAMVHGGETIRNPQQEGELVGLVRQLVHEKHEMADLLANGSRVEVHTETVLQVDGREIARINQRNTRNARAGLILPRKKKA